MTAVRHVVIAADGDGQRIDNYLLKILKKVPKSRIYRMLRTGEVRVDGKRVQPVFRLNAGQTVRIPPVSLPGTGDPVQPPQMLMAALERRVVHECADFFVLDKPAGLAVHAGSGIDIGVIEALQGSRSTYLELVHRLDRDTSGLLLVAKTPAALRSLQVEFRERRIVKLYRAVVHGCLDVRSLSINLPLQRFLTSSGERRVRIDEATGQVATTIIHTRQAGIVTSTLDVEIHTGRTHQIRVHLNALGHPVVGDDKYGRPSDPASRRAGRLLLHAWRLEFGFGGRRLVFEAPVPEIFTSVQDTSP